MRSDVTDGGRVELHHYLDGSSNGHHGAKFCVHDRSLDDRRLSPEYRDPDGVSFTSGKLFKKGESQEVIDKYGKKDLVIYIPAFDLHGGKTVPDHLRTRIISEITAAKKEKKKKAT